MLRAMKSELIFWLWCRWRGHGNFPADTEIFSKSGRPDFTVRICTGCERIYPEDADAVFDALEADLL